MDKPQEVVNITPTVLPVKTTNKDDLLIRMQISSRKHSMEGATIKNMSRAFLYAMEAKEVGLNAEDIK